MNCRRLIGAAFFFVAAGALVACGGDDANNIDFGQGGGLADASADGSTGGNTGLAGTIIGNAGAGGTNAGGATGAGGGAAGSAGSAGSSGAGGVANDAGPGSGDSSTRDGGSNPEGGVISCGVFNDPCQSGTTCCSGICDPASHTCASVVGKCSGPGVPCSAPTDCCSLNCGANKICDAVACTSDGQTCASDAACCGGKCNVTCQPLNNSCKTAGNACTASGQCCSGLCGTDGHCALGASYCIQTGDACAHASDCCGGICNKAANATLGTCAVPAPGGTRCSGAVDGTVCNGCGSCCSRLCAPYGPTGVFICQPANGCHIDGDLCLRDKDCCGNDNSLPTSGQNVQCVKENVTDVVGICRNPMGCSPEGNVCHYKQDMNYACNVSSAPNDCCGAPGNSGACQLDQLGVPRCNAIGMCRKGGETCAFTNDCCNNVPCVPDDAGQLRCLLVPDGGTACVQQGGNCTITGDCCPGTNCIVAQGSTQGKCGVVTPPPSDGGVTPPPDGGTLPDGAAPPDAGPPSDAATPPPDGPAVCSQYGQICNGNPDCCNGIPCTGGICRIPPM